MEASPDFPIEIEGICKTLPSGSKTFKQLHIQETICIPQDGRLILKLLKVYVSAEVLKLRLSDTPTGMSLEGQCLTGSRLEAEGSIKVDLNYMSGQETNTICSSHIDIPFYLFIVLNMNDSMSGGFNTSCFIEDLCVRLIENSKLYFSIILTVNAEASLNQ